MKSRQKDKLIQREQIYEALRHGHVPAMHRVKSAAVKCDSFCFRHCGREVSAGIGGKSIRLGHVLWIFSDESRELEDKFIEAGSGHGRYRKKSLSILLRPLLDIGETFWVIECIDLGSRAAAADRRRDQDRCTR